MSSLLNAPSLTAEWNRMSNRAAYADDMHEEQGHGALVPEDSILDQLREFQAHVEALRRAS